MATDLNGIITKEIMEECAKRYEQNIIDNVMNPPLFIDPGSIKFEPRRDNTSHRIDALRYLMANSVATKDHHVASIDYVNKELSKTKENETMTTEKEEKPRPSLTMEEAWKHVTALFPNAQAIVYSNDSGKWYTVKDTTKIEFSVSDNKYVSNGFYHHQLDINIKNMPKKMCDRIYPLKAIDIKQQFTMGNYQVNVKGEFIKVGCSTFSLDEIKKAYRFINSQVKQQKNPNGGNK